jgi:uncharacterized protein YndB with AHSA1/START domain
MLTRPRFEYVTYIATTPEKLWQALVDPDQMRQYWIDRSGGDPGHVNVSDWKPSSPWEHQRLDPARTVDVVGKIVESTAPRRLALTWARPNESGDRAKHSRVSFDVEPKGDLLVRLAVTHEDLEPDPKMLADISAGWSMVLSNLKTLLETGRPLQNALEATSSSTR